MDKSKLAIVIPFYKKSFFKETLVSLAQQTDKRFHVYIGDDGSPENPEDLLDSFNHKVDYTYKRFNDNLGSLSLVKHWERCLKMINNESWFMILGDDDVLGKNVVAHFYNNFGSISSSFKCVRFATVKINDLGNEISDKVISPIPYSSKNIVFDNIRCSLSEHIFNLETFQRYGFDDYPLAWYSDIKAILKTTNFGLVYIINEEMVQIRISNQSISGLKTKGIVKEKNLARFKFYKDLISSDFNKFSIIEQQQLIHEFTKTYLNDKKSINRFIAISHEILKNNSIKGYLSFLRLLLENIVGKKRVN